MRRRQASDAPATIASSTFQDARLRNPPARDPTRQAQPSSASTARRSLHRPSASHA
jgi:hypothetical protein